MVILTVIFFLWAVITTVAFYQLRSEAVKAAQLAREKEVEALCLLNTGLILNKPEELANAYVRILHEMEGEGFNEYAREGAYSIIGRIADDHQISGWPNYGDLVVAKYEDFDVKQYMAKEHFGKYVTPTAQKKANQLIKDRS